LKGLKQSDYVNQIWHAGTPYDLNESRSDIENNERNASTDAIRSEPGINMLLFGSVFVDSDLEPKGSEPMQDLDPNNLFVSGA